MILKNCTGDDLIDYKIYGNSTQKSTTGKNKFSGWTLGKYINVNTGNIEDSQVGAISDYIPIDIENNHYYISGLTDSLFSKISFYDENKNYIGRTGGTGRLGLEIYYNMALSSGNLPATAKYMIISTYKTPTVSGSISIVNNLKTQVEIGTSATSYEEYSGGQASPNPDFPQEIKSVGDLVTDSEDPNFGKYKIPVKISGKNLFDGSLFSSLTRNTNGSYKTNTAYTAAEYVQIKLKPNTNYAISLRDENYNLTSGNFGIYIDGTYIYAVSNVYKFTTSNEITNIKIAATGWSTVGNSDRFIQLEEGSSATEYEPYREPITVPIYLDAPLIKIGDVADYIDFGNKKVIRNIGKTILDGSENWYVELQSYKIANFNGKPFTSFNRNNPLAVSNRFIWKNGNSSQFDFGSIWYTLNGSILVVQKDKNPNNETLVDFKTWLSIHNIDLIYLLKAPTEETVDLPAIPTFEGTTIIEIETETQPSNMWVQYYSN